MEVSIDKGLLAKATLVPPGVSEDADKAWGLIQAGALRGLSIGFRPLDASKGKTGINYDQAEIFELSVVTVPCNAACYIIAHNTNAKAAKPEQRKAERPVLKPFFRMHTDPEPEKPKRITQSDLKTRRYY